MVNRSVAPLALGACVTLAMPAQAFAKAVVRFVHAVPGVGRARVSVNDGTGRHTVGAIRFGQATGWDDVRSGPLRWTLRGGGRTLASGTTTVGRGAYDIVVLAHGSGVRLGVYKARGGKPGTSLVRVIHAAPELGSPELTLDGKVAVKSLAFTKATPYVPVAPGMHSLGADRPGSSTPVVSHAGMTVKAGKSYSAVVVGSRGQLVRVIALVDRSGPGARPAGADTTSHRGRPHASGASAATQVTVRPGDSLWTIARRLAGPGASDSAVQARLVQIWDANQRRIGTGNPDLIFPGTVLHV